MLDRAWQVPHPTYQSGGKFGKADCRCQCDEPERRVFEERDQPLPLAEGLCELTLVLLVVQVGLEVGVLQKHASVHTQHHRQTERCKKVQPVGFGLVDQFGFLLVLQYLDHLSERVLGANLRHPWPGQQRRHIFLTEGEFGNSTFQVVRMFSLSWDVVLHMLPFSTTGKIFLGIEVFGQIRLEPLSN